MDGTIGEIKLFSGTFEPRNWVFCHGQTLNVSGNDALYSILGTRYGGDGLTTFSVPNIKPVLGAETNSSYDDLNYIICINGYYPSRS